MTAKNIPQTFHQDHISVCICTYKRPELLEKLLLALNEQYTDDLFTFSAVVVDNDCAGSAHDTVCRLSKVVKYPIKYVMEPRQNIALARNRAVLIAQGDFIAMIDDDEVPVKEWLINLFKTLHLYKVDGVLGPVLPAFPPQAPQWLIKSGLCDRISYATGIPVLIDSHARTGNVLFHRRVFNDGKNLFEEQFGRTGGEDIEFFDKRIEEGFTFVWCDEARVYENILSERLLLSFYLKKNIRFGGLTGEKMRQGKYPLSINFLKSICLTIFYTLTILFFSIFGRHIFARHLTKYVYHISRLLGTLGLVIIREK
jgi:succinoglycan biosynthesis protein ExoM